MSLNIDANGAASSRTIAPRIYCPTAICDSLNELRKKKKFCDLIVVVDNVEYLTHKIVLITFSPFFERMFSGDFMESREMRVNLCNIDASIIEMILDYAYTGKIQLTKENVKLVLYAAHFLQAESLFEDCCRLLESDVSADTCFDMWNLSEVYSCAKLKELSTKFILAHFTDVSKKQAFLELEAGMLINIISNDKLNVGKEETVFDAVIRWFNFDEEKRKECFDMVLSQVRLAHLNPYFLTNRVETIEAIRNSPALMRLVEEARTYALLPNRRMDLRSPITRRRLTSSLVEVILVKWRPDTLPVGRNSMHATCLTEDGRMLPFSLNMPATIGEKWTSRASNYKLEVLPEKLDKLYYYHVAEERWEVLPGSGFVNVAVAELDDTRFSGSSVGYYRDIERYEPLTRTWSRITYIPEVVWRQRLVSVAGFLYVFGTSTNRNDGNQCIKVQQYDPYNNIWKNGDSLTTDIQGVRCCALDNRVYICGFNVNKIYFYDCATSKWGKCASLKNQQILNDGYLATLNGRLVAVAFRRNGQKIVERYTNSTDSWEELFVFCPGFVISDVIGPLLCCRDKTTAAESDRELSWRLVANE